MKRPQHHEIPCHLAFMKHPLHLVIPCHLVYIKIPFSLRTNEIDSDLVYSLSEPERIVDVGRASNSFLLDNIKDSENLDSNLQ